MSKLKHSINKQNIKFLKVSVEKEKKRIECQYFYVVDKIRPQKNTFTNHWIEIV